MSKAPRRSRVSILLKTIRQCPCIDRACKAARVSRSAHYQRYKTDPAYAKAFDEAREIGWDRYEDVCVRDAMYGIAEPIVYQGEIMRDDEGEPVLVYKVPERLRIAILKGRRAKVYNTERVEHTGADGGTIRHESSIKLEFVDAPQEPEEQHPENAPAAAPPPEPEHVDDSDTSTDSDPLTSDD